MAEHDKAARWGRRVGLALFGCIVCVLTAIWSVQILIQVWSPRSAPTGLSCREGILELIEAVRRARHAAAAEAGGEREAIAEFRRALEPEWTWRGALTQECRSDREARRALGQVDRLRYAEENAVRYETLDLAPRRRRVRSLEAALRGESQ
jgi:hypothetical protein